MNVAVLGLGFMGATHVKAWGEVQGATLGGVMTSDPAKKSFGGNLLGTPEQLDLGDARIFKSVESVLADTAIDAVDICLPTDLHAPVAIAALRAGKHVLVEKPMALDFASAEAMRTEAERAGRLLMAAHVLRFIPAYRELAERVKGRIESALFQRNCALPSWSAWLCDTARSGGAVLDLLIHDIDFCISLWGMPESVSASGDIIHADLRYSGMGPVVIEGGWHPEPDYPFSMSFVVETQAGSFHMHDVKGLDPFVAELQYFTDCINEGWEPEFCPSAQSAQAVKLARFILESRDNNGAIVRTS